MCDCNSNEITQSVKGTYGNPCALVTTAALDLYRLTVQCVINENKYEAAGVSQEEATITVTQLTAWLSLKQQNPDDCTYMDFLPIFQKIVGRIVNSGVCR